MTKNLQRKRFKKGTKNKKKTKWVEKSRTDFKKVIEKEKNSQEKETKK